MHFSELARDFVGEKHPLYQYVEAAKLNGEVIYDLVRGNVTEHGINFPKEVLQECLSDVAAACTRYSPDPLGLPAARQAIADYYGMANVSSTQIVLTPGTSVSFWYCLKLLADEGAEVLTPAPSYPLLDYIAQLCGVTLRTYKLDESRDWSIDIASLENAISEKTRAIVIISPHNPTGMFVDNESASKIAEIARKHNLAIIVDEVFAEFVFDGTFVRLADQSAPLVFTLNGFSKTFALPGVKIGWIAVSGDAELVKRSLDVLETISDTFLPVSEISQALVPRILSEGGKFLADYRRKVAGLRDMALDQLQGLPLIKPRAGFYVVLPVSDQEEELALKLFRTERILVHPGHFYDMEGDHLVFTYIQEPEALKRCLSRIKALTFY